MYEFHSVFGKIFTVLLFPFRQLNPWFGMIFVSLLTGIFMLIVFRYTSNQKGIKRVKNKIKAHLLELRLYKDNLGLSMKAQGNILLCNAKYISYTAKPMVIMIIPLILILIQLNFWFAYAPLQPGQEAILKIKLSNEAHPLETNISVSTSSPDLVIETPPLRITENNEVNWRLSATTSGSHEVLVTIGSYTISKKVDVGLMSLKQITPVKKREGFFNEMFYPVEKPIPKKTQLNQIEIIYPAKNMNLFGWRIHWLIVYFVLSILFGFGLKGIFKVDI